MSGSTGNGRKARISLVLSETREARDIEHGTHTTLPAPHPRRQHSSGPRGHRRGGIQFSQEHQMKGIDMDDNRLDAIARDVAGTSRRAVLGVLAAGLAGLAGSRFTAEAEARKRRKKKRVKGQCGQARCQANCADRTCGSDGCGGSCGACPANQVCAGGTCCQPEPRASTCAGRCGTWRNTCGQPVECAACPAGQVCLGNGSCAITCTTNGECGVCGCSNPDIDGNRHCIAVVLDPLIRCSAITDCPPGSHCQDIGSGGVCIELCH